MGDSVNLLEIQMEKDYKQFGLNENDQIIQPINFSNTRKRKTN